MKKDKCFGLKERKCKKLYQGMYKALRKASYSPKEAEKWIKRSLRFTKNRGDLKEMLREAEKERKVY